MSVEVLNKLRDPKYFIERFMFIIDKARKLVRFRFNPPQQKYYEQKTNNDLILKARKEGFSSEIEALFLHACIFGENENCVTMAHTWDDTVIHLDRVKNYLSTMGVSNTPFVVTLDKENQKEIYFPHSNSRYWIGTAGSRAFGRGRDITKLHLSEVAHYENQTVLTGIMEACVPGAYIVMETTANGVGELFNRLWEEASDPLAGSPWRRHFFAWFEDPSNRVEKPTDRNVILTDPEKRMQKTYDLDVEQVLWYRFTKSKMADKALMVQEHPSNAREAFISSGRPAFNLEKLAEKKDRIKGILPVFVGELEDDQAKIKTRGDTEGRLRIYKHPRKLQQYLITADSCEGVALGDFAVMQVFDRESWEQVATWRARIDPGDFGREMVTVARYYNYATVCPELNNHGWATIEAIKELEYPHLLSTKELWGDKETVRDGWPQTEKTRNFWIVALRNSIDDDTIYFNDNQTLTECETFVQNKNTGKFEAQIGCHDDTVVTSGIGAYCLKHLVLDKTKRDDVARTHKSPLKMTSIVSQPKPTGGMRRSATGYR